VIAKKMLLNSVHCFTAQDGRATILLLVFHAACFVETTAEMALLIYWKLKNLGKHSLMNLGSLGIYRHTTVLYMNSVSTSKQYPSPLWML
jgi:hypothetical protein